MFTHIIFPRTRTRKKVNHVARTTHSCRTFVARCVVPATSQTIVGDMSITKIEKNTKCNDGRDTSIKDRNNVLENAYKSREQ